MQISVGVKSNQCFINIITLNRNTSIFVLGVKETVTLLEHIKPYKLFFN